MTTITENTTIKKAPAKKTPAKATPVQEIAIGNVAQKIASGTDAIHEAEEKEAMKKGVEIAKQYKTSLDVENQERINKVVDNTKILSTNLKEYTKRLDSIHEKNDKLSDKLTFVNDANVTIMFPNHLIESIINKQIEKVNNKLMDSINEAQEVIEVLERDDIEKTLDSLNNVNDLKSRLKDLEYEVEEKPDTYWVEDEISSMTSEFLSEYDINQLIEDEVMNHTDGFVTYEDLREELRVLKKQLNKPSIFKRITKLIKKVFSYNLKSKVRSKLFSIKK